MRDDAKYPGDLGVPMEPIWYGLLGGESLRAEACEARDSETLRRMHLLASHFGRDPEDPRTWFAVALRLAVEHVPGLSVRNPSIKSGAKKVWDGSRLAVLVFEMNRQIATGMAVKKAAFVLSKKRPWSKLVKGNIDKAEALRAMYTRWRKRPELVGLIQMYGGFSRTYFENGDPEAWEESLQILEKNLPNSNFV